MTLHNSCVIKKDAILSIPVIILIINISLFLLLEILRRRKIVDII